VVVTSGDTYHPGSLPHRSYHIKEVEVFLVSGSSPSARITTSNEKQANRRGNKAKSASPAMKHVTKFSDGIKKAINKKHACLLHTESEMLQLEESFKDKQTFIEKFASGDTKDVVTLNVSSTIMVTKPSTLCTAKDSVLAKQFEDSKWTEQGCNAPRVNEWMPDQVSTWAKSVDGLPEDVSIILYENEITGRELLALTRDNLKTMGMKRVGNVALLLKEIDKLEEASRDNVTLINHSPYCFGKMLDYLRSNESL